MSARRAEFIGTLSRGNNTGGHHLTISFYLAGTGRCHFCTLILTTLQWQVNNEEIKGEIKKYFETNEWKHGILKFMGCNKGKFQREIHYSIDLPQETKKISSKQFYA